MTNFLRNLSIYQKLLAPQIVSGVISLFISTILLMVLEITSLQSNIRDDLSLLAQMIGNRSNAALLYSDKKVAEENLAVLNFSPIVETSCFYNGQAILIAEAHKSTVWPCPKSIKSINTHFESTHLVILEKITINGEMIGSIYIHADLKGHYLQKVKFCGFVFIILSIVGMVAFVVSKPLLKFISLPIEKLVTTVKLIIDTQDFSVRAIKDNNDELGVLVTAFNNMIATVQSQNNALIQAKNRYLALFDDNPTMVFNLNELGVILSVNQTAANQLHLAIQELLGRSIVDFVYLDDISNIKGLLEECMDNSSQPHKRDFRQICDNNQVIWVRATCKKIIKEAGQGSFLLVCEDITEARILNEKIAYQASHDPLTGLGNRPQFEQYVKQAVYSAKLHRLQHVLCFLDLDRFKIVNDTCGHLAGDELLKQLGDLFKKNIRRHDFVARLGGDEFSILMHDCTLNEAVSICEKLRDKVQDFQFAWEGRSFSVGVSIGLTAINISSSNATEVLKEADTACYAAKDKGRNRVHVYRPNDEVMAIRQGEMQWVERIQQGFAQNRFCLYGQPIAAIGHKEEGLHFETLVRFKDENGHIIPPGAFLPAAERYGLASEMDRWVIGHLFEWMAKKPGFIEKLSVCSVNLSGVSMSDETMLAFIHEQFDKWRIPPHKICFEVTETAAIANLSFATNFIHQLQYKGCLFSLDDFGSGLSSFAYLKNLPVDFLKIDGLFVKDIIEDKVDLAMVRSINEVAHVMGKKTIAEFVENEQIFKVLKSLGVDYAQGYGIGKPIPLAELKLVQPFPAIPV